MARVSRPARSGSTDSWPAARPGAARTTWGDQLAQRGQRVQRVAQAGQLARAHRAQRQPRGDAFDVGKGVERGAQRFRQAGGAEGLFHVHAAGQQGRDGVLARQRRRVLAQRVMQPAPQQPAAHGRAAAVQQREQRGRVLDTRQGLVSSRLRRVTGSSSTYWPGAGRQVLHVRQRLRLSARGIAQQRAGGADAGRHVLDIEAGQRVGLEMRQQVGARAVALEVPVGHAGAGAVEREGQFGALGADDLGRRDAVQLGFQLAGAHSVTRKSPLARFSQARPARGARALPPMKTEASARSALAGSSASSVSVLA